MEGRSKKLANPHAQTEESAAGASPGDDACVHLGFDSLHDLVSPVNQMCSMADLVFQKYRGRLDDDAELLFGFIQSSANRLQSLLAGLRTYAQAVGSPGPYRQCAADDLVAGALALMQETIDRSGAVVTRDPLPELYCDPSQIMQTFASLIDNSIKFRRECRPEIHVSASLKDRAAVFSFRDNGIGIDARNRDRIFGVFKRVHNEGYPGAGVGLAIVKRIVERHGGRIWVESDPGKGSTFFLELPMPGSAARIPRRRSAPSPAALLPELNGMPLA